MSTAHHMEGMYSMHLSHLDGDIIRASLNTKSLSA